LDLVSHLSLRNGELVVSAGQLIEVLRVVVLVHELGEHSIEVLVHFILGNLSRLVNVVLPLFGTLLIWG
jgi:hypothetical protein